MNMAQKLATFLVLAIGGFAQPATASEEPFTFLNIPIRGTIGIDVTLDGVKQAIALAISEDYDSITLEFDAMSGDLDDGMAIAGLFREAGKHLRTIAIVRQAGGSALPIAFACKEWVVLEETSQGGADRTALQILPTWSPDPKSVKAELTALANGCVQISPVTEQTVARARSVLMYSMTNPGMDLMVKTMDDGTRTINAIPASAEEEEGGQRILIASKGPGIDAKGLAAAGLAKLIPEGLQPLRRALGVEELKAQGDSGVVLVGTAAEDQFKKRKITGSLINSAFTAVDGIDSLSSGMPWTLERAKISDPMAKWRLWRYQLQIQNDKWVLSESGNRAWRNAVNFSIQKWMGVETISKELSALLKRVELLHAQLKKEKADPLDRVRLESAIKILEAYMPSLKEVVGKFAPLAEEARRTITKLENSLENPPTIPVEK